MKEQEIASLVRHRLEQAQTALEDARYLLEGDRSPQGIVNRAYYAMFYAMLALLQKIRKVPSKHTGAISLFDTEFVVKGEFPRELSKVLHKAFELRQVSDYTTLKHITKERAQETLNSATQFVKAAKSYLGEFSEEE